jgi:hypothetical protein
MFDDDIGCVAAPADARPDDVVTPYARAIVSRRFPGAPDERADALARAFVSGDPSLKAMAVAIERELDATRVARSKIGEPKARQEKRLAPDIELDGGVLENDSGGPSSIREQLVGTWATSNAEDIVDVHTWCADGGWALRYESTSDIGRMAVADLDSMRGTWEVVDGDPPTITLTQDDGEQQEGALTSLTEEAIEVAFEGDLDDATKLTRRSKTAVCE